MKFLPVNSRPQRLGLENAPGGPVPRFAALQFLFAVAVFAALLLAIFLGFRLIGQRWGGGGDQLNLPPGGVILRVTGPSMAPTIWGPHAEIVCQTCEVGWKLHWQPEHRPQEIITCWNCGAVVPIDRASQLPGDDVVVVPLNTDTIHRGDLVAIADTSTTSDLNPAAWVVKRVAAVPGQSIAHENGWLYADDQPLWAVDAAGQPIWIIVHDDSFRATHEDSRATRGSWWRPRSFRFGVEQSQRGFDLYAQKRPSDWLDYHHQAVHNAMRPDVIRDDVPGNAAESRALVPVDSVAVSFEAQASESAELEVVFRIGDRTVVIKRTLKAATSHHWLRSDDAVDLVGDTPPQTAARSDQPESVPRPLVPISIRLTAGHATLRNVAVWRPLRYRIDPRTAADQAWPIRLQAQEYYLLGDNVPLSIDSRHWGPIPRHRIVGRIYTVGYDNQ